MVIALYLGSSVAVQALGEALCCVLGQDTLLSQCLSPPRCKMGTCKFNAGGSPAMD